MSFWFLEWASSSKQWPYRRLKKTIFLSYFMDFVNFILLDVYVEEISELGQHYSAGIFNVKLGLGQRKLFLFKMLQIDQQNTVALSH